MKNPEHPTEEGSHTQDTGYSPCESHKGFPHPVPPFSPVSGLETPVQSPKQSGEVVETQLYHLPAVDCRV